LPYFPLSAKHYPDKHGMSSLKPHAARMNDQSTLKRSLRDKLFQGSNSPIGLEFKFLQV
jgi:hypothetical protein